MSTETFRVDLFWAVFSRFEKCHNQIWPVNMTDPRWWLFAHSDVIATRCDDIIPCYVYQNTDLRTCPTLFKFRYRCLNILKVIYRGGKSPLPELSRYKKSPFRIGLTVAPKIKKYILLEKNQLGAN